MLLMLLCFIHYFIDILSPKMVHRTHFHFVVCPQSRDVKVLECYY